MSASEFVRLLTWRDVVDVLAVAIIVYYLLQLIRGTRAAQIVIGLALLGAVYYFARLAHLATLQTLLGNLLIFLPFATIVLFQQEIRRALASFGRSTLWTWGSQKEVAIAFNEFAVAATALSARRIGALIVVERLDGLRGYVENGIRLDARLSYDLLINLFNPDAPLHDGAVIVQGDRIAAAACFLPLTQNPELSKDFGTRHRAALGISEETDCVAIVVSEESGVISLACDGKLTRNLDAKSLLNQLYKRLITDLSPHSLQTGGAP
jgi:diadenylate cyclase